MKRDPSGYWATVLKGGPGSGSWDGPGQPRFSREEGDGKYSQARTGPLREINSIAAKHGFKKVSGVFNDEDMKLYEGSSSKIGALQTELKLSGYKAVTDTDKNPLSGSGMKVFQKTTEPGFKVFAGTKIEGEVGTLLFYGRGIIQSAKG